jgi:branched-chain amino acid aminotransferase
MNISLNLKSRSDRRVEPFKPEKPLPFGKMRTDHMFLIDFNGEEWINPRIVPYDNIGIAPGAVALHYAQQIFEGCKAFMHEDGEIYTFRNDQNAERLNRSAEIMCMPTIPVETQLRAIHTLLDIDRLWFPLQQDASMYIRPFMFGTSDMLGVKPSTTYTYCIFLSPSGPYYAEGFTKPIRLLITDHYHRAASGGSGEAKAGGNYGASLRAGKHAQKLNASQVLYLDSTNTYIEEAGAMNHFHVKSTGEVIIPEFTDTILRSITSRSFLELSETNFEGKIKQEHIALKDFLDCLQNGTITEAGGFGTAAVVSPVGCYIKEDGSEYVVGNGEIGPMSRKLYETLTGMQKGLVPAPKGWVHKVERQN